MALTKLVPVLPVLLLLVNVGAEIDPRLVNFGGQGFTPGTVSQGFNSGSGGQGFNPGASGQGFNLGSGGQGYNSGSGGQGFNPGSGGSGPAVAFTAVRARMGSGIGRLMLERTLTDVGNSWDNSRSELLVYYPGVYQFSWSALSPDASHLRLSLMRNGLEEASS